MKKIAKDCFLLFTFGMLLCSSFILRGQTTYYISSSGNDAAAGTSTVTPWKTLSKVNASTFSNGDIIRFNKGDTFPGKLVISTTGITIDAYGTGGNPTITGLEQVSTAWIVNTGNIWETTFTVNLPAAINNLDKAGVKLPISRFPNKDVHNGYLNFESHASVTQFTDNELSGSPNWTSSEIVIRAERFRLNRTTVTSHSGSSIQFPPFATSGIGGLNDGYGYFFVNDLKAIDTEGEWAYKSGTGKLYLFSTVNPNTTTISFSRFDTAVVLKNVSNVAVKNIDILYPATLGISISGCSNITIDAVNILHSGGDGVIFNSTTSSVIKNSTIADVNWSGIFSATNCSGIVFDNNNIYNIGDEAFGKSKTFIGIDCNSPASNTINNTVRMCGYAGIISCGQNNLVKRNFVDSACVLLSDMGGIYTNNNINNTAGMIIEENIILHNSGELLGAPTPYSMAHGVYLDNTSHHVTVRNNTVAYVKGAAYFINAARPGHQIYDNTAFKSGKYEMVVNAPFTAPGMQVLRNILVNDSVGEYFLFATINSTKYKFSELGVFRDNYLVNPFNDTVVYMSYRQNNLGVNKPFTTYGWETAAPEVSGTSPAPLRYSSPATPADLIKFYFNRETSSQTFTLPAGLFIDAKNQAYCGSVTLDPFKSVVLFKKDDGACVTPSACDIAVNFSVDSVRKDSVRVSWPAVAGSINYDVRYRPENDTLWKYANNLPDTSVILAGLKSDTYYRYQARTSCYGSESPWQELAGFQTEDPGIVFINADTINCGPSTAFATTHNEADNKWTLQNSSGVGTLDRDFMRSSSITENAPEITLTANGVLDTCGTYDIFLYYLSISGQPWKIKARLSTDTAFTIFDRSTPGAVLLADVTGTTASNRLFRAKLGTANGSTGFAVVLDDVNSGTLSRSIFDGVGYLKTVRENPMAPDSLHSTNVLPGSVSIAWLDNSLNETAYRVERRGDTGYFSAVATLPAGSTSYMDTSFVSTGTYTYRVYAVNGTCKSYYSNQLTINNDGSLRRAQSSTTNPGIKSSSNGSVMVYPNPFNDYITVNLNDRLSRHKIRVSNLYGQIIMSTTVPKQIETIKIPTANYLSGIYLIEIISEETNVRSIFKIIKR